MNILAFDTGLNKTYIALKCGNEFFSETVESTDDKYHSAFLIQKIVGILSEHSLRAQDIDLFATNVGPGSFTGIRVGLTVARGLAQGTQKKAVGINSLELISAAYGLPAIAILDARKNKAYVGNNEKVELVDLENLPTRLRNFDGQIIADTKMHEFLYENGVIACNFEKEGRNYGRVLIELALKKYDMGNAVQWQELKPLYIQPPPIHVKS
ncbi:MAG: tRNA (adenosine(37)-N6)-threonylcarbamoyltransferase complex dimerization subunit type 1 TsaB [bacterium]|nr:tRNA (adenosine(37)-N6)-threonylcarbamoyltransferase complex dimerization subunit type 1 TsaB [bacterium]